MVKKKYICDYKECHRFTDPKELVEGAPPHCVHCGSTEVRLIEVRYKILKAPAPGESYKYGSLGDHFRIGLSRNKWKRFRARARRNGFNLDAPYTPEKEARLKAVFA